MPALDRFGSTVPRRRLPLLPSAGEIMMYSAISGREPLVLPRADASPMSRLLTITRRNLRTFASPEQRRRLQGWVQQVQTTARQRFDEARHRLAA